MNRPLVVAVMAQRAFDQQFTAAHMERLQQSCEVLGEPPLRAFSADAPLERAEILLTSWGCPPIDEGTLAKMLALKAIVHAAGTVKGHVTPACWDRGIAVTSASAANAIPVAEFTLAAIIFANKRVFRLRDLYREHRSWSFWQSELLDLGNYRKTVGIVGASRIGRRVIELLRQFDWDVQVHDPYLSVEEADELGVRVAGLDDLIGTSDVVSLHAPSLPETQNLIDARRLGLLREGATLINTARGALVDHDALAAELAKRRIFAVIDTTEPEILPAGSPLYELPNVFLTPHIAGSMGNETHRMTDVALEEIERYVAGKPFQYAISKADLARIA
jgi:phosphoglycerate dehydrogenase-like enzyme